MFAIDKFKIKTIQYLHYMYTNWSWIPILEIFQPQPKMPKFSELKWFHLHCNQRPRTKTFTKIQPKFWNTVKYFETYLNYCVLLKWLKYFDEKVNKYFDVYWNYWNSLNSLKTENIDYTNKYGNNRLNNSLTQQISQFLSHAFPWDVGRKILFSFRKWHTTMTFHSYIGKPRNPLIRQTHGSSGVNHGTSYKQPVQYTTYRLAVHAEACSLFSAKPKWRWSRTLLIYCKVHIYSTTSVLLRWR